jgi:hypothetical protein
MKKPLTKLPQSPKSPSKTSTKTTAPTSEKRGLIEGYRSGLEGIIAEQILRATGEFAKYETLKVRYVKPAMQSTYTPDFQLPNGIIIETKGRFVTADRQKHRLIREQYPELDIRFVFSNSKARISKQSQTTYAAWCERYGFKYADRWIPEDWFNE